jgi:carbamoyltransferase
VTVVLGINAYHSSASAALMIDGEVVAAVEEERFTRQKYETGFPARAARYCLGAAGVSASDVEHVAVAGKPAANLARKLWFATATRAGRSLVRRRGEPVAQLRARATLAEALEVDPRRFRPRVHRVEHHIAHLASAFFVSPFERAAVASFDGFGDMVSTMWAVGEGSRLRVLGEVAFPHSLGMFYLGFTQYLGFARYGEEYKVMGLASYGEPEYLEGMRGVLRHRGGLGFELDMGCFRLLREIQPMTWRQGPARLGPVWDAGLVRRFGPVRSGPDEPLEDRHRNVAASMQRRLEEVELSMLRTLHERTGRDALCLAGGVALNCVVNGKVRHQTGFRDLFVQPAAYDGGTSLGAAAFVYHHRLGGPRRHVMDHAYLGPEYGEPECRAALDERPEMRDVLNARVKHREPFRPFAPAVLEEEAGDWFEDDYPSPFMLLTYPVRPGRRERIPAPTHVDGTGRLQTVRRDQNPRYYDLIRAFGERTGVPVLLNTSFNENEPICCTPREAVATFRRGAMDVLVLGNLYASAPGPART